MGLVSFEISFSLFKWLCRAFLGSVIKLFRVSMDSPSIVIGSIFGASLAHLPRAGGLKDVVGGTPVVGGRIAAYIRC